MPKVKGRAAALKAAQALDAPRLFGFGGKLAEFPRGSARRGLVAAALDTGKQGRLIEQLALHDTPGRARAELPVLGKGELLFA